jgi:DNA-binding LacI/PurR family transcriptional regulator
MAMGALKAANDARVRVPGEISVAGFDGLDMIRFFSPSLTTVRQPVEEMSQRALQLLLDQIGGSANDIEGLIRIKPQIIPRESTGPVPAEQAILTQ